MAKQFNFRKVLNNFKATQTQLPRDVARLMVNHTKKAFADGGFTDKILDPWALRKRKNKADKATGKTRAILVDSGNMRRSPKPSLISFKEIRVGAYGVPYATYHNQGIKGRLPQRKFIGKSTVLMNSIRLRIRRYMDNLFK